MKLDSIVNLKFPSLTAAHRKGKTERIGEGLIFLIYASLELNQILCDWGTEKGEEELV